jgi:hypothetical protein
MTRWTFATLGAVLASLAACNTAGDFLVVTVDAQPAVHGARALTIALTNAGTTRTDTLDLRDQPFPVTFSISTPGRTGELAIAVDATDTAGRAVGHATLATTTATDAATLTLDSVDFVVNTDFANDQYPDGDFEAAGFQLAASPDGTWTAAFRDSCAASACTMFGRRFDQDGNPADTMVAAGTNVFNLSSQPTTFASTPAIAATAATTLAVWDYYNPTDSTMNGIACRALDSAGRATAAQSILAAATSADVASVAPLANGNFVASWTSVAASPTSIRAMIVKPDCTAVTATPIVVPAAALVPARRGAVASSGTQILFTWIADASLHVRLATLDGTLGADTVLAAKTATDDVVHARVAAGSGGGFVVAARWARNFAAMPGPGRIELFRVPATGAPSAPSLVTDQTASDADNDNDDSFALASRADGAVLVAWHTCGALGDGNLCGVFGRVMRDTGEAVGDAFAIPTTTAGDQKFPSVAALPNGFVAMWSDASAQPPDVSGLAVRARILYKP